MKLDAKIEDFGFSAALLIVGIGLVHVFQVFDGASFFLYYGLLTGTYLGAVFLFLLDYCHRQYEQSLKFKIFYWIFSPYVFSFLPWVIATAIGDILPERGELYSLFLEGAKGLGIGYAFNSSVLIVLRGIKKFRRP